MKNKETKMVEEKTWEEFRSAKLLWFINQTLHLFGWAIVYEFGDEHNKELITRVYPARVKFRGFDTKNNSAGYKGLSEYIKNNINELCIEASN